VLALSMRGAVPLLPKAGEGIGGLYFTHDNKLYLEKKFQKKFSKKLFFKII
jgi:hypothetical protein